VAGSGIPKVAESGKNRGKLSNIAQFCVIEKSGQTGETNIGQEPGLPGTGSWQFNLLPNLHAPHPNV